MRDMEAPLSTAEPGTRKTTLAAFALVALAAIVCYLNSLGNGFALDDFWIVPENPNVTSLSNLLRLWTEPYWPGDAGRDLGLYRPLPTTFYNLEWAIGGGASWPFHAANVLLHALVSVLVLALGRRFVALPYAAAGALLFAVHPVHTEAVANVVGQAELLAALFGLLACLAVRAGPAERVGWGRIALVALCYGAAVASKENALVLPALVALVLVARRAPLGSWKGVVRSWLTEWRLFAVLAAVAVAFLVIRWRVLGSALSVDAPWVPFEDDPPTRVRTALRLWNEYLRLLVWPFDLAADYSPAVLLPSEQLDPMVVTGAALLAGTIALTAILPWRPLAGLCAGWFLVAILPTSNLLLVSGVVLAERTLYLPSVALALAAAGGAALLARRLESHPRAPRLRWLVAAGAAVVVVGFGARTWSRNPDWASTVAVNAALLRDHPESYKAQWFAAGLAFERGDTAAAGDRFVLALRLEPNDPQVRYDYGEYLMRTNQVDSAIAVLEVAARDRIYLSSVNDLLALAYLRAGRCTAALQRIELADARHRTTWQTRLVAVEALFALGRIPEAADAALPMAAAPGVARTYRWQVAASVLEAAGRAEHAAAARAAAARLAGDDRVAEAARAAADAALRQDAARPCRSP